MTDVYTPPASYWNELRRQDERVFLAADRTKSLFGRTKAIRDWRSRLPDPEQRRTHYKGEHPNSGPGLRTIKLMLLPINEALPGERRQYWQFSAGLKAGEERPTVYRPPTPGEEEVSAFRWNVRLSLRDPALAPTFEEYELVLNQLKLAVEQGPEHDLRYNA